MIKIHNISLLSMKKDKKIKELDDWLAKASDYEFDEGHTNTKKDYNDILLDYDFEYILNIDSNTGQFEYKKKGVQDYVLNKLRKKKLSEIETGMDLHGETVKDSIIKLNDFFSYAYNHNIEFVKIICGKGTNSIDKIPKIKITVQAFVKESELISAACTASINEGGSGVLKIKLKR